MATFGKPENKHPLRKAFLKATIYGVMLFGSYQYYTPNSWKDAVGQKVEHVTHSQKLGQLMGEKKPALALPATPAPASPTPGGLSK